MWTSKFLLPVVFAVLLVVACGGDGKSYIRENERILETLPEIPGAERISVDSSPYSEGDSAGAPVSGYTTTVVYRAPTEMTARDVVDFYVNNLMDDWEYRLEELGIRRPVPAGAEPQQIIGTIPLVYFTRGTATVSVNTGPMTTTETPEFEVVVDLQGAR